MPLALESIYLGEIDALPPDSNLRDDVTAGGFRTLTQGESNWCWAAVGSGLYNFLRQPSPAISQSEFASRFGETAQDEPRQMAEIIEAMNSETGLPKYGPIPPDEMLNIDSMLNRINDYIWLGKPVPIVIDWTKPNTITHVICVIGPSSLNGQDAMIVYDPFAIDSQPMNIRRVPLSNQYINQYKIKDGKFDKDGVTGPLSGSIYKVFLPL